MVALNFLADRLGLPASHFLGEQNPVWGRLLVDIRLASGEWQAAADGYSAMLETPLDDQARAEALRGLAEALCRLDRGREAIKPAAEAARLFDALQRASDAALARYWFAYGLYLSDEEAESRAAISSLLERVRAGLVVEPDFEMRLLVALSAIESRVGEYARSLAYLEAARGYAERLDARARATFLFALAISYRETGDVEAAIRTGLQALALYRAAGAAGEAASIQNDLALAYLAGGNRDRAAELVAQARVQAEQMADDRLLAAILETEARVALAGGKRDEARALAGRSAELAHATGNRLAELAAILTDARALREAGSTTEAEARYEDAARLAAEGGSPVRRREVLREWAALRAESGDHRGAYELTSEALLVN
jgi:tetratricopeptide (TPR) repeat protein